MPRRLQPGIWLLDEPLIISGLWEILHHVSLGFFHSTAFNQRLQLSLTHSQYIHLCAFTFGSFFYLRNCHIQHYEVFGQIFLFFFPSLVLYNFLFPIFFFFTFVHLKVKYHQTKAKQQPALGQKPRESSNLQLSAWSKGRDYCHLNPLPLCNFHHFLLLCSLVYYKPRRQSRGLTWREARLILLGNYVIFQGNVHLAVDKIKSNKTNFRSDII